MNRYYVVFGLCFLFALSFIAFDSKDTTTVAIEKVITDSYINGAFNKLDTKAMRAGFHPDFAIFSADGNNLARYEIGDWIKGTEERKKTAEGREGAKLDGKIVSVDYTGGSAAAKVEYRKDGKMVYTDYLSLLEFEDGWKISAKVYHAH